MDIYTESSLADSIIFQTFNQQSTMVNTINNCIKNAEIISASDIEEQIIQIRRTRLSPFTENVLKAFEDREIIILFSKVIKVPQALPFTVAKIQGKVRAFIFANNYASLNEVGKRFLNIPMKDLYVLMEGAYTALRYNQNPIAFTRNLGLMKTCASIYSSMIMRIMNKEYTLSIDQELYNRVQFTVAKFFLTSVWGCTNDDVATSYAVSTVLAGNKNDLSLVNEMYKSANINTIEDLIEFMKTMSPRLSTLNMRYFTQCYLNTFKAGAIFSMECLPYFLYVVEAALLGSFLINQPMVLDVLKGVKGTNTFYPELARIL